MEYTDGILLAAHRGDKKNCPENTMPAFQKALERGVDMIETDIHRTADGVLILMHDRNTLRTTGVDGLIDAMTLEEIRKLDAGATFAGEFKGTAVPTVQEFMEWLQGNELLINWELKDYPDEVGDEAAFAAADQLIDRIEENGLTERSMLNTFSDRVLEHIAQRIGKRMPLHGQGIRNCQRTRDQAQMPQSELYDWCCLYPEEAGHKPGEYPQNFAYCLEHGILPCVCVPDVLEDYARYIELGCRMFTSNDIDEADRILRELGLRN